MSGLFDWMVVFNWVVLVILLMLLVLIRIALSVFGLVFLLCSGVEVEIEIDVWYSHTMIQRLR